MDLTDRCYNCECPSVYFPNIMLVKYLQCSHRLSIFLLIGSVQSHSFEGKHTYITMLINRTFPFCGRPQRATLSVSEAESSHSLGPIHVFPMLQFTHWIRPWPKKVFRSQLSSGKEKRRSGVGGEILKPFQQCCLVSPVPLLERVMCFLRQKEDLQRYAKSLESVFAGPVKRPL